MILWLIDEKYTSINGNVTVTTKAQNQLVKTANEFAFALASELNISDEIIHGIAPLFNIIYKIVD